MSVYDHYTDGETIGKDHPLCSSGRSTRVAWPTHKTIDDVERDAFMSGQSGVVDIITRYAEDLLYDTIPADEAKDIDKRINAAFIRAAALEEAARHVVLTLRAVGRLSKAQTCTR